jgi:hypothetical protein
MLKTKSTQEDEKPQREVEQLGFEPRFPKNLNMKDREDTQMIPNLIFRKKTSI